MFSQLTDLQMFLNVIEQAYGPRTAYRYLMDDRIEARTFAQLAHDSRALASWLVNEGFTGKHIAIIGSTSYPWITAFLGIITSGNVVVPVDQMLTENEIWNILKMGDVDAVFASEQYANLLQSMESDESQLLQMICLDGADFDDILRTKPHLLPQTDPEGLAEILFTSGTTGISKGVMLSQKNICANLMEYYRMDILANIKCAPVAMSVLPIHHTYELTIGHLGMLYRGITVCINDRLENILTNLNRFRPAIILVVPAIAEAFQKKIVEGISTGKNKQKIAVARRISKIAQRFGIDVRRKLYQRLLDKFGGNLTSIVVGGAALRLEVAQTFEEFGVNMYQGYGLTECAPLVASNCPGENRLGSVGKPICCMTVKIDQSEILVKGDCVMLGYYKDRSATAEVIDRDGWFHTGDLGHLDEDGYLYITGRSKNLIILANGKNIYPEELEGHLTTIDGVKDVIVYAHDGKLCAAVHPSDIRDTAATEHIRAKLNEINAGLPAYKRIVSIDFIPREFPKTTTMKIKRREAQQMIEEIIRKTTAEHIQPTTPMQKKIVAAFEETLGRTGIGIGDDFFAIGGDSLAAVEAALMLEIQVQDLYTNPTAAQLEAFICAGKTPERSKTDRVDVNGLIRKNSMLDWDQEPKCVLLTGATGFLGSHILRELSQKNVSIVCLVRDPAKLKRALEFYFPKEKNCFTYSMVVGDIEKTRFGLSDEIYGKLICEVDMVIHTAANVNHAGHYEDLERTNVTGTQNVIDFCKEAGAVLQHTSTASVSGSGTVEQTRDNAQFDEFCLDVGQMYQQNVYIHSKYKAEELVLLARNEGLLANIFRIGNLTWRMSDGKFQKNAGDNGFVQRCKGLFKVGIYGEKLADYPIDFTPVDECAAAYVALCFGKKVNNIYHLYDPYLYTIESLSRKLHCRIRIVPQSDFECALKDRMDDNHVAVLAFYNSIATLSKNIPIDNKFTLRELQRLGFQWSKPGLLYLRYFRKIQ